jgi:hypothetical protein
MQLQDTNLFNQSPTGLVGVDLVENRSPTGLGLGLVGVDLCNVLDVSSNVMCSLQFDEYAYIIGDHWSIHIWRGLAAKTPTESSTSASTTAIAPVCHETVWLNAQYERLDRQEWTRKSATTEGLARPTQ